MMCQTQAQDLMCVVCLNRIAIPCHVITATLQVRKGDVSGSHEAMHQERRVAHSWSRPLCHQVAISSFPALRASFVLSCFMTRGFVMQPMAALASQLLWLNLRSARITNRYCHIQALRGHFGTVIEVHICGAPKSLCGEACSSCTWVCSLLCTLPGVLPPSLFL